MDLRGGTPRPGLRVRPSANQLDNDLGNSTLVEAARWSMPRAVLVAAAVGGAFGLGLIGGGFGTAHASSDTRALPAAPADPIAAAEAATKAYEARIAQATTTWHRELTGDDPAMPALPQLEKMPRPKPTAPVVPVVDESDGPAVETVDQDVVAATRAQQEETAKARRADDAERKAIAEGAAADRDDDVEHDKVAARKPAAAVDGDQGDVSASRQSVRVNEALQRVLGEKPAAHEQTYALQLASTATREGAEALAGTFKAKGLKPVVVAAEIPGKGTMYRIRVVGLGSREAADALKTKVGQGLVVAEE